MFDRMKIVLAVTITLVLGLDFVSALDVRLALGSDEYEGNVEIFYNGTWGYICDDSWGNQDARVICRMLGFNTSGALAYSFTHFTNGILLNNINCSGSEQSIDQCSHNGWIAQSCNIYDAVRVSCGSSRTTPSSSPSGIDVRLVGGSTEFEGIVEMFYNGSWRLICNYPYTWNISEARVVCRMLGFGSDGASAYCCNSETFLMDNVICTGEENSIDQCTFIGKGWDNCGYYEIAGVRCDCSTAVYKVCPPGQYNRCGNCTYCPFGRYQNQTVHITTCLSCPVGHYQNQRGQTSCLACSIGQYQNFEGVSYCKNCPKGQYQNLTGQSSCLFCPTGQFQNVTGQSSCFLCPSGQYQHLIGESSCVKCLQGQYQNLTGQTACLPCPIGQYQNSTGESLCMSCPLGFFQNNSGQLSCLACPPGKFQNITGQSSCLICPIGEYQNLTSQSTCALCPLGQYQNRTGQSSCLSCRSGYYQNLTGQFSCLPCPVGQYQNFTGQISCVLCPIGKFQNLTGQTSCIPCPAGQYQANIGQTSCLSSPVGYYQNETGQAGFVPCSVGQFQNQSGQSSCFSCAQGQYQNETGQAICLSCPSGQYQNLTGQSSCLSCPTGQFQNVTGQSSCLPCPSGQYQHLIGESSCVKCLQGQYQNLTGQTACLPCPIGQYQNSTGESLCCDCPMGTYQNQLGQVVCLACPPGTFQNLTGESACTACQPGTFQNFSAQISCLICPIGSFSNRTGEHLCNPCEVGTFQNSSGQSSCVPCDKNKTTRAEGSESEDVCYKDNLFQFGSGYGDIRLNINEDACSEKIDILPLRVFGRTYNDIYICTNGIISLNTKYTNPNPPYTQISGFSFLSTYYTDIDLGVSGNAGEIYYQVYTVIKNRNLTMDENIVMAQKIIRDAENMSSFAVKVLLIVTWSQVRPYPADERDNEKMSFQAILATDGLDTFFLSVYIDGEMHLRQGPVFIGYNLISGQYTKHLISDTSSVLTPDRNIATSGLQGLLFYRLSTSASKESNDEITCLELFEVGQTMMSTYNETEQKMPQCPCTLDLLKLDDWFTEPVTTDAKTVCSRIRPAYWFSPYGKTCCYDNETGTYLTLSPRAGGFLTRHPVTRWKQYESEDVYMKEVCCQKSQHCDLYYLLHPTGTCYLQLPSLFGFSWGDPHIVTLDGFNYTFNGWGEYTLVEIGSTFIIQARTDLAARADGDPTNATIFSAFAALDNQNASIHIELNKEKNGMIVYGNRIDFTSNFSEGSQYSLETDTLSILKQKNDSTLRILFPSSGIYLNVSIGIGMLTLGLSIPRRYSNQTKGLLGNFNSDSTDDLMFPNGTRLNVNATERQIFQYGQTWRINTNQSVFIYPPEKSGTDFDHPQFVPKFLDEVNEKLISDAIIKCETNLRDADITTCVYDLVFTNNTSVAFDTGKFDKTSTETSLKADNSAPSIHGQNVYNVTLYQKLSTYANCTDDSNNAQIGFFTNTVNANLTVIGNCSVQITWMQLSDIPAVYRLKAVDEQNAMTVQEIVFQYCTGCSGHGYCDFNSHRDDNRSTSYFKYAKCICDPAWQGENCEDDFDGCLSKPCSNERNCTDVRADVQMTSNRSYICSNCPEGYVSKGDKCIDINECEKTDLCNQTCNNTYGSYVCSCNIGYRLQADSKTCTDIDECSERVDNCKQKCINTNGYFQCACLAGFRLNSSSNQCISDKVPEACNTLNCSKAAGCTLDQNGNAVCFCERGYQLNDNQQCDDIDECDHGSCSQTCKNTRGSYMCTCLEGYQLAEDKITCKECSDLRYGMNCSFTCQCERGAIACNHVKGCLCRSGWTGENCNVDIDECSDPKLYDCGEEFENKQCMNVIGSYECKCKAGFQLSNGSCTDIDECSKSYLNLCEQKCENVLGNYTCTCDVGFVPNPSERYSCKDVDECEEKISGCEQICDNVAGRFNCYCHYGYILDKDRKRCIRVFNPCDGFYEFNCSHICLIRDKKQECLCRLGYYLAKDKQTCLDINECINTTLNRCIPQNVCNNTPGGYTCSCPAGQKLENNGRTCAECDDYHYGENCAKECACSPQAERCDKISGCVCPANWTGSKCETQKECAGGRNNCTGQNNECVTSAGIRFCTCRVGYKKTDRFSQDCFECVNNTFGKDCSDSCKCFEKNVLSTTRTCNPSSGLCICKKGWRSDCSEDVDECLENTHNCTILGTFLCLNLPGGFECKGVDMADLILIIGISLPGGLLLVFLILIICFVRRKLGKSKERQEVRQRSKITAIFTALEKTRSSGPKHLGNDPKFDSPAVLLSGKGTQPKSIRSLPEWAYTFLSNDTPSEKFEIKRPKFNPVPNLTFQNVTKND
ncbi:hypothetical protein CHS0354_021446 [Potamilus streckersoni]|uniref:Uncharacterized protein n=1 Tax=Potamilus streckersoni TaxID=2493646 RepID=A0AAE0VN34_9BIVA|nr:hypothetical protein CHS0354_021446 [Potamilus streckersoni]